MSVGQHDPAQVSAPEAELGECRCQVVLATWNPGVDHGQLRAVLPHVHLANHQPDQMKLCTQLGDLHNRNVARSCAATHRVFAPSGRRRRIDIRLAAQSSQPRLCRRGGVRKHPSGASAR